MDKVIQLLNKAIGMTLLIRNTDEIREVLIEAANKLDEIVNE